MRRSDGNYVRTGKWTFFFPDGRVKEEGEYEDDLKTGRWLVHKFYSAYGGGLKHGEYYLSHEEVYENGDESFRREYIYKPPSFTEGAIVDGKKDGKWPTTTTDGVKIAETDYKAGKMVGWELRLPTGEPFAEFENDVYILRGVKQDKKSIPQHQYLNTQMWQGYCQNAWQHAYKELRELAGK